MGYGRTATAAAALAGTSQAVSPVALIVMVGCLAAAALKWVLDKPSRAYKEGEGSVGSEYDAWTEEGILEYYWVYDHTRCVPTHYTKFAWDLSAFAPSLSRLNGLLGTCRDSGSVADLDEQAPSLNSLHRAYSPPSLHPFLPPSLPPSFPLSLPPTLAPSLAPSPFSLTERVRLQGEHIHLGYYNDADRAAVSNPFKSNKVSRPHLTESGCLFVLGKSKFPHKFVNMSFIFTNLKNSLTNLCGSWLLQNDVQALYVRRDRTSRSSPRTTANLRPHRLHAS